MALANYPIDKVRQLQRRLYLVAKRSRRRRFHALYDRIARRDVLVRAFEQVCANRGSAGVDGQTIAQVKAYGGERLLDELREKLEARSYRPLPVRRVFIPKADGKSQRPLGIPAVVDRIAQTAAKLVLEPIFEATFKPWSYGFRPKRSALLAVAQVRKWINYRYCYVVEVDIRSCGDNSHVRFGGRAGETGELKGSYRASARPYGEIIPRACRPKKTSFRAGLKGARASFDWGPEGRAPFWSGRPPPYRRRINSNSCQ